MGNTLNYAIHSQLGFSQYRASSQQRITCFLMHGSCRLHIVIHPSSTSAIVWKYSCRYSNRACKRRWQSARPVIVSWSAKQHGNGDAIVHTDCYDACGKIAKTPSRSDVPGRSRSSDL